jgi:hypothetical protein
LKIQDVVLAYREHGGLPTSYHLHIAAIEAEILCAVWLLTRRAVRGARAAAIILFALFAAISLRFAILGIPCPCFGRFLIANAWLSFSLDVVVVALLSRCRLDYRGSSGPAELLARASSRGAAVGPCCLVILLPLATVWLLGQPREILGSLGLPNTPTSGLLTAKPAIVNAGNVPQRGRKLATFELSNSRNTPVDTLTFPSLARAWS